MIGEITEINSPRCGLHLGGNVKERVAREGKGWERTSVARKMHLPSPLSCRVPTLLPSSVPFPSSSRRKNNNWFIALVRSLNWFDRFLLRSRRFLSPPRLFFFFFRSGNPLSQREREREGAATVPSVFSPLSLLISPSFSLFFCFGSPEVYRQAYIVQPGLHVPSAFRE